MCVPDEGRGLCPFDATNLHGPCGRAVTHASNSFLLHLLISIGACQVAPCPVIIVRKGSLCMLPRVANDRSSHRHHVPCMPPSSCPPNDLAHAARCNNNRKNNNNTCARSKRRLLVRLTRVWVSTRSRTPSGRCIHHKCVVGMLSALPACLLL